MLHLCDREALVSVVPLAQLDLKEPLVSLEALALLVHCYLVAPESVSTIHQQKTIKSIILSCYLQGTIFRFVHTGAVTKHIHSVCDTWRRTARLLIVIKKPISAVKHLLFSSPDIFVPLSAMGYYSGDIRRRGKARRCLLPRLFRLKELC